MSDAEAPLTPAEEAPLTPAEEVAKSGRAVCVLGLGMVLVTWGVAGLHALSATHVESSCNTNLRPAELRLAVCNAALGVIVAGGVLCTRQLFGAVQHVALIRSQEAEGLHPEVQERATYAKTVRGCSRVTLCVQSAFAAAWVLLSGVAAVEAYGAKLESCGDYAVMAFWPLSALNFAVVVINAFVYKCVDV